VRTADTLDKTKKTMAGKRQADELGNLLAVVSISTAKPVEAAKAALHAPSNSTSTIFATNAISHPNFSEIVQAVAFVVSASLECADQNAAVAPVDDFVACYDERTYDSSLASKPVEPVTVQAVSAFIGAAIKRGNFSCEVLIISLVLFNRLIFFPEHKVIPHARSWRLMFVTAIMVAQKLFDDVAVDNVDFPIVWKSATKTSPGVTPSVKAFGQMETKMMQLLKFSVYISPSLYAQYY